MRSGHGTWQFRSGSGILQFRSGSEIWQFRSLLSRSPLPCCFVRVRLSMQMVTGRSQTESNAGRSDLKARKKTAFYEGSITSRV